MAEHRNSVFHVGQLNLRVPGESAETGHRIANGIAESLARKVPAGMQRQLGAQNVRVRLPAGATEAEMSDAISEAIVKALDRGGKPTSAR